MGGGGGGGRGGMRVGGGGVRNRSSRTALTKQQRSVVPYHSPHAYRSTTSIRKLFTSMILCVIAYNILFLKHAHGCPATPIHTPETASALTVKQSLSFLANISCKIHPLASLKL